ncbi:hypothetical protein [Streptomyces sp. MST-110588]|uniref:hypothetical protein n=1 Tax=Streptomyces sp. MST-110588 TaxID=2833628 RepID=UPI001F5D60FA|nr:hypothetical protein [Streptomyces sp. MST-110588]UNO42861.1 hypothetical protein KGS77_29305 [Streptomyces sp. MST-110588]
MREARTRFGGRLVQWGGWAALAAGAVLCAIGWYGVSGERFAERQIPYLASCTIPGAALIVAGAMLVARGDQGLAAARVEELYGLLVAYEGEPGATEPGAQETTAAAPHTGTGAPAASQVPDEDGSTAGDHGQAPQRLFGVPGGTLFHRPRCPLVAGRPDATPLAAGLLGGDDLPLRPCPICEPPTAAAGEDRESPARPPES